MRHAIPRYAMATILTLLASPASYAENFGTFVGRVVAEWLSGGREMKLVEPFSYISPKNMLWDAPTGSIVDGASIPRFAWSIIGGPFEGKYRNASVIHDVACVRRDHTWQDVHEAFYTAMLASDVDTTIAKIMYAAVYHFGPRWDRRVTVSRVPFASAEAQAQAIARTALKGEVPNVSIVPGPTRPQTCRNCVNQLPDLPPETADISVTFASRGWRTLSETQFNALQAEIETKGLSIEQIENYTPPAGPQR